MARYLITELSFIDNRLVQVDEEIVTDATPAAHWEPLNEKAEKARAAFDAETAKNAETARKAAELQFLRDNPANLTPATPQEIAYIEQAPARAAAAAKVLEDEAAAAKKKAARELARSKEA
jgi:hypothetical protein